MVLLSVPVKPKSLPDRGPSMIAYRDHMPEAWRDYLRDSVYWLGELENDEQHE